MKARIRTLSIVALLSPALTMADCFEGFYASVGLGVTQTITKFNQSNDIALSNLNGQLTNLNFTDTRAKHADNGPIGALSLGYTTLFNARTILGLEMRGFVQNTKMDHNQHILIRNSSTKVDLYSQVKLKYQYGLVTKLGWLMSPQTQIYGLAGAQFGQFKSNARIQTGPINTKIITTQRSSVKSLTKGGYLLGLGIEHAVSCNSTVGLEYNFASYGSISVPRDIYGAIEGAPTGSNFNYTNQVNATSNITMIKYSYYFCS